MAVDLSTSGSALSNAALPFAFVFAFAHVLLKPRRNRRRTRLRTALRVILSPRIWLHSSTLLDFQYFVVGLFGFSVLFGYTLLTGLGVSHFICGAVTHWLGPYEPPAKLPLYFQVAAVFCLYLSFEFAYWFDHFLSHKIPILWEFHKVHHSATVLTPIANWRVHPVDSIIYMNIQVMIMGSVTGVIQYFAGETFALTTTAAVGVLMAIYMGLWGHAQHSQFWISWTGLPARIFLSPAHHQIHHSRNPIHFDKNFGASLAVWDWLFRTLHVPQRDNEHLRFGTDGDAHLKRLIPSVIYPFAHAAKRLIAMVRKAVTARKVAAAVPPSRAPHDIADGSPI